MAKTTLTNYLKHLVPSRLDKWYTSQKVCDKSSTLGRKTGTVLQFVSSGSELWMMNKDKREKIQCNII